MLDVLLKNLGLSQEIIANYMRDARLILVDCAGRLDSIDARLSSIEERLARIELQNSKNEEQNGTE